MYVCMFCVLYCDIVFLFVSNLIFCFLSFFCRRAIPISVMVNEIQSFLFFLAYMSFIISAKESGSIVLISLHTFFYCFFLFVRNELPWNNAMFSPIHT